MTAAAAAGAAALLPWAVLHGRRDGEGWGRLEGVRYAHRGAPRPRHTGEFPGCLSPGGGGRVRRGAGRPSDEGRPPGGDPRLGPHPDVRRAGPGGGPDGGGAESAPSGGDGGAHPPSGGGAAPVRGAGSPHRGAEDGPEQRRRPGGGCGRLPGPLSCGSLPGELRPPGPCCGCAATGRTSCGASWPRTSAGTQGIRTPGTGWR